MWSRCLCFAAGLHGRAGVEGSVSRGGRRGGAARQVEPAGGEELRQARGGHAEGQASAQRPWNVHFILNLCANKFRKSWNKIIVCLFVSSFPWMFLTTTSASASMLTSPWSSTSPEVWHPPNVFFFYAHISHRCLFLITIVLFLFVLFLFRGEPREI